MPYFNLLIGLQLCIIKVISQVLHIGLVKVLFGVGDFFAVELSYPLEEFLHCGDFAPFLLLGWDHSICIRRLISSVNFWDPIFPKFKICQAGEQSEWELGGILRCKLTFTVVEQSLLYVLQMKFACRYDLPIELNISRRVETGHVGELNFQVDIGWF